MTNGAYTGGSVLYKIANAVEVLDAKQSVRHNGNLVKLRG